MASAPSPGKARREAEAAQVIRITHNDETLEFRPGDMTLEQRVHFRKEVGLPFEAFVAGESAIGEDTLAVWWWMAKRQNHQPRLSWRQFGFEWQFDPDAFDIEVVENDPDDPAPEGSGPGSDATSLA